MTNDAGRIGLGSQIMVCCCHQVPSTSATSGEAAHTGTDSEDEVEASFKAAADRLRLQRQEEQMPIEDRLNM